MTEELLDLDDGLGGLGLLLEGKEFGDGLVEVEGLVHVEVSFSFLDLFVDGDVVAFKLLIDL